MEQGTWWLLESAAELFVPFHWLVSPDVEDLFNKPSHGLDRERLVVVLADLFQRGHVNATRNNGDAVALDAAAIRAGLDRHVCRGDHSTWLYYGLTQSGGAHWESVAKPNWAIYIDSPFDPVSGEVEVIAQSRDLIERHDGGRCSLALPGTVCWDVVCPWNATYWKTLPQAHRLRYRIRPDDHSRPFSARQHRCLPAWFDQRGYWYTRVSDQ